MKTCSMCKETKDYSEFNRNASHKDGLGSYCKTCIKAYRQAHKAEIKAQRKEYREAHKSEIKAQKKEYRQAHKDELSVRGKEYRQAHKDEIKDYKKKYGQAHKAEINAYRKNRIQSDPQYKAVCAIKGRLHLAIRRNLVTGVIAEEIGCTSEFLRTYLEYQFYPHPETGEQMTWENRSKWHIHHKEPLNSVDLTDPKQRELIAHWTNLQPLWACDHRAVHA